MKNYCEIFGGTVGMSGSQTLEEYLESKRKRSRSWDGLFSHCDTRKKGTERAHTPREILQQPWVWRESASLVASRLKDLKNLVESSDRILFTGAGSSVLVGKCLELAFRKRLDCRADAVPTTDLILDPRLYLRPDEKGLMISFSRSGASRESFEAIQSVHSHFPSYRHLLITCNPKGELIETFAGVDGFNAMALHPATCDQGLAMTSSFTSMVLAAQMLTFSDPSEAVEHAEMISHVAERFLEQAPELARRVADLDPARICLLGARELFGAASEGALKILELTDGRIPTLAETYLGVRHGPLSFLNSSTAVVCLVSTDHSSRHYERDLIAEVKEKELAAMTVATGYELDSMTLSFIDEWIEMNTVQDRFVLDELRPPVDAILPQLLGLTLSLRAGLDPDNPSPRGAINRVAEGVTIYQEKS